MRCWFLIAVASACLAQEPSPPPAPPPAQTPAPAPAPAPPPEPPPVLVNQGKPMHLSASCGDAEIVEFGMVCREDDPCPVFLEISSVEAVGNKLFLAGNVHVQSATLWSVLLASEDMGKTWTEPAPRIRGAALDLLRFVDFENGWVAGQISSSLPKDPFVLKTSDGGKSWKRFNLFEETAYGAIESLWFESKTQGSLNLNMRGGPGARYQRLETTNGGESWAMKQSSPKPLPPLRPRVPGNGDLEWRAQPDAKSKSYRIEQKQSAKWSVVASFELNAGVCKPSPPAPPPPPEAPPPETTAPENQP
jgi:hypothetical protein